MFDLFVGFNPHHRLHQRCGRLHAQGAAQAHGQHGTARQPGKVAVGTLRLTCKTADFAW